jgi:hypothetical protein
LISESELRRRLDEIKEELDLAKERASEADVQELIGRAEAIVEARLFPQRRKSTASWSGVGLARSCGAAWM